MSLNANSCTTTATPTVRIPFHQYADFVIHFDDTAFHVHKLVLHFHSGYFRALLETLSSTDPSSSANSSSSDSNDDSASGVKRAKHCDHPSILHCIHLPRQTVLASISSDTDADSDADGADPAPEPPSIRQYSVGDHLDVLDTHERWCAATVLEVKEENVFIHYDLWSPKWDEVSTHHSPPGQCGSLLCSACIRAARSLNAAWTSCVFAVQWICAASDRLAPLHTHPHGPRQHISDSSLQPSNLPHTLATRMEETPVTAADFRSFLQHLYFAAHYSFCRIYAGHTSILPLTRSLTPFLHLTILVSSAVLSLHSAFLPKTDVDLSADPAPLSFTFAPVTKLDWSLQKSPMRIRAHSKYFVCCESLLMLAHYLDCAQMLQHAEAVLLTMLTEPDTTMWLSRQCCSWLYHADQYGLTKWRAACITTIVKGGAAVLELEEYKAAKRIWSSALSTSVMEAALTYKR